MKPELTKHLIPLCLVLLLTSTIWVVGHVAWINFVLLTVGLSLGAFFLDTDHLIYWLYTHPQLEESRLARIAINKKDIHTLLNLLELTHKKHTNLIFHHYIFQLVLIALSLFVFTSTGSIFGMAFLFSLNLHLWIDEFSDFQTNKTHLQDWLFARSPKQLPQAYFPHLLIGIGIFLLFCLWLLIKTKL